MIDFAQKNNGTVCTTEEINEKFLELMPKIVKFAKYAFKNFDADRQEDAIQSVLVTAFENVKQLGEQGRLDDCFVTPITKFAIGRYREGRPGGVPSCGTDVTSERCRYLGRSTVKNYGLATEIADSFESMATATDARYPVHKTVALRIDFMQDWYRQQTPRDQEIIRDLAMGETTNDVSRKFGISAGRVSQLRKTYANSWFTFINPPEKKDFIEELKALAAKSEKGSTN